MEQNRNGRLPWAIVLLVIAFACAIAYSGAYIFTQVSQRSTFGSRQVVELDAVQQLQAVDDGFVYYDGSYIAKVDDGARARWSYMMGGGASFEASEAGVAAWTGRMLTLIDGESGVTTYSGNMDADILSARVGQKYAAILLEPEHDSTIVLMETGGRRVDSILLSDQTVIDYGFFYEDTLFWVMTLDTNGTVPSCTIRTYRPGVKMVGLISDTEQIFYHAMFPTSQIICTGDTYIKSFTYNGTEDASRRKLVYGWTLIDADDFSENPIMAFVPNAQYDADLTMQDVRMIRGSADQTVRMPFGCSQLIASGERVYGFSSDGYVMIAQMGRQKVDAYPLEISFDQIYGVTDAGVAVLGQGNTIYLVSLK